MSQTKRAYDKFLLYALLIIALGVVGFISATTVIDPGYLNTTGPVLGSTGTFTGAVSGTSGSFSAALTGTTLDTGQGANDLFDMDQNVLQASAVTFSTVNTGQGANELWDMNQNVQTTSSVTFDDVTVSDELILDGETWTRWPDNLQGATAFAGFNINNSIYDNYFYCTGSNDGDEVQSALDYVQNRGGGILHFEEGIFDLDNAYFNISSLIGNYTLILEGEGWPGSEYDLSTSNGTVLHWAAPYGIIDVNDASTNFGQLTVKNLGMYFTGDYDALGGRPIQIRKYMNHWENVRVNVKCTIPGSATAITLGKTGPQAEPSSYKNVQWIDQRQGGDFSFLVRFYGEIIELDGNSLIANIKSTVGTPRLFRLNEVTHATIRDFLIFTTGNPGFDADGTTYEHMWYYGGAEDTSWYFDNSEFLLDSDVDDSMLQTLDGEVYVYLLNPWTPEGSYAVPIAVTVSTDPAGSGVIYVQGNGLGYEWHDQVEASNDDWVAFPRAFAITPRVTLSVQESDANYFAQIKAVNTTHWQLYLYNATAAGVETDNITINYIARVDIN